MNTLELPPLSPAQLLPGYRQRAFTFSWPNGSVGLVPFLGTDPNRVLLTISTVGSPSTNCAPIMPGIQSTFYVLNTPEIPKVWTYADFGPIVGMAWGVVGLTGGTIFVIEQNFDPTLLPIYSRQQKPVTRSSPIDVDQELARLRSERKRRAEIMSFVRPYRR